MTSDKHCCVPGCYVTQPDTGVTLHRFPNPIVEPDRYQSWLYAIGGDILKLDDKIIKHRRVCHKHFEPKYCTRSRNLSKIAVPTLCLPEREPPQEKGTLSWLKSEDGIVPLDEHQDDEDVQFVGQSQLVPDLCDKKEIDPKEEIDLLSEFSCNICHESITGFRYACAQCRDWDLCGACEARGEHATHFVLRIPPHRTLTETQTVLTALRQLLDGIIFHDDPDLKVIKDEVKTEDPLDEGMAPQEPSPAQGDAAAHSAQAREGSEPLCAGDSAAGEDEFYDVEYLETESEASMSSINDSETDVPRVYKAGEKAPRVYTARKKRKLSLHSTSADRSYTVPGKVQKHDGHSSQLHNGNNTSELTRAEKSDYLELVLTEDFSAVHREMVNSAAPQIKINDRIKKCVDKNAVIAPYNVITSSLTATNNFIQKSKRNHKLRGPHAKKDCINVSSDDSINNTISIDIPTELSLSVKQMLELPLDLGVDAIETRSILHWTDSLLK